MTGPQVTVLLPVYNGLPYLQGAVESILAQTFENFEFLIINDGSRDGSAEVLDRLSDSRIRVVHQANRGLAATLNIGIEMARGRYIARQDQDDLSLPDRLAKQVQFLDDHPNCNLLGTAAEIWVGDEPTDRYHDHPAQHAVLAFQLLFNNPFVHSSVMFRRDAVQAIGGYTTDSARQPPEDYELWSRMARAGRIANLAERLLIYREVPQSMSRTGENPFAERLVTIASENLALSAGLDKPNEHAVNIAALAHQVEQRLSQSLHLTAMIELLKKAGAPMAHEMPEVQALIDERIRILRYQWTIKQTNTGWALPALRTVRDFARAGLSTLKKR